MRAITISALGLLALAIVPFPSEVTPKSTIRVVDETSKPVSNVVVYRSWEHFGLSQHSSKNQQTDQNGQAMFSSEVAWGGLLHRALMPALSIISPHASTGARTRFEIYCPSGYELYLPESEYTLIGRTGDYTNYRSSSGNSVFVDYSPPNPKATIQYSVRVCLDYDRTNHIDFTLPIRRVGQDKR